jgi:hypothetical protein
VIVHPPARPVGRRGRIGLSAAVLAIALVLGFAGGAMLTQNAAKSFRQSDGLGRMLCGPGQHIDRVPVAARRRGYRLICRDAQGRQTGGRNNVRAVVLFAAFDPGHRRAGSVVRLASRYPHNAGARPAPLTQRRHGPLVERRLHALTWVRNLGA